MLWFTLLTGRYSSFISVDKRSYKQQDETNFDLCSESILCLILFTLSCQWFTFLTLFWCVTMSSHGSCLICVTMVAHGRVVTSSRQITEVKQRQARLVLGWVTARCSSHAPAMCRGVGQASHITMPLSTQQWWVPGGMRKLNCNDWL